MDERPRKYTKCSRCKADLPTPARSSRQCPACYSEYLARRAAEGRLRTTCYRCGGPMERPGPQPRLCRACGRADRAAMDPEKRKAKDARNAERTRKRKEADPEYRRLYNATQNAKRYGLSVEEYERMIAGPCEICGSEARLVIDHDHDTGQVRGPLCTRCNFAIGHFDHDPAKVENAADYLRRHAMLGAPV